ncbi:Pcl5p SCDLUD_004658 [Saccharomycodes ludwigii]|uniref:Pcl5p n=1 Tax=Saccharomycodes ludwigii TaxID=36035 RepID=UPI001E835EAE|nr:hypothetical protein SCDLUD_004658 [Saccharomycodes ludwigii]KAH3899226.1 hypothetical protein SCDLUD_004658 [Saccharomycodes ludwigii]
MDLLTSYYFINNINRENSTNTTKNNKSTNNDTSIDYTSRQISAITPSPEQHINNKQKNNNNNNSNKKSVVTHNNNNIKSNALLCKIAKYLHKHELKKYNGKRTFDHYINFLTDIIKRSKSTKNILLLTLYYLIKIDENCRTTSSIGPGMSSYCSKRKFFGCLVLAHKYLNDKTFKMDSWFIISGGGLSKLEISQIERWCLGQLDYNLYVRNINDVKNWCLPHLFVFNSPDKTDTDLSDLLNYQRQEQSLEYCHSKNQIS